MKNPVKNHEKMRQIMDYLHDIKAELDFIKKNMPDKDMFLNREEEKLLSESIKNEKKDNIISSKNLKKELGI